MGQVQSQAVNIMKKNNNFLKATKAGTKLDVHHLIPLEYAQLFNNGFNPNNVFNLYGVDVNTHKLLNKDWSDFKARFKKLGIEPTKQDVLDFAAKTLKDYGSKLVQ